MQFGAQREINPQAVAVPEGLVLEAVATGLTLPGFLAFGPGGDPVVSEIGALAGRRVGTARVLRIRPDGEVDEVARFENPIGGVEVHDGALFVLEGGVTVQLHRFNPGEDSIVIADGFPGGGDHGPGALRSSPDDSRLYFGIGTRTNSGVVGLDNLARGWAALHPNLAEATGRRQRVNPVNYVSTAAGGGGLVSTGPYAPFGDPAKGALARARAEHVGGSVYQVQPDGKGLRRLAWGLRTALGIAFNAGGAPFVSDRGMENRGSRPIWNAPDAVWEVKRNAWFGWPDFCAGKSVEDVAFRVPGHAQPRLLMDRPPKASGDPLASLPYASGAAGMEFTAEGELLLCLSGSLNPSPFATDDETTPGHRVVRINLETGEVSDFLANVAGGPASATGSGGLERPCDIRRDPNTGALYILDMGQVVVTRDGGVEPIGGTGVLWRLAAPGTARPATVEAPPEPEAADQPTEPTEGDAESSTDASEEPETSDSDEESTSEAADEPEASDGAGGSAEETASADDANGDEPETSDSDEAAASDE